MLVAAATVALAGAAWAQQTNVAPGATAADRISGVRLEQKLNAQVPLDTTFIDETGRQVRLGDYAGKKPIVLSMIFYKCPGTCSLELDGLSRAFKDLKLPLGTDYESLTVSINPKEGPDLARVKKLTYLQDYNVAGGEKGWHFLTGSQSSIQTLAKAVGFRYTFDLAREQFSHPSGILILTPEGRVSRYLFGVDYEPRDLRFALVEASRNKIGSPVEKVLLLTCYQFDPTTGKYGFAIAKTLQASGILTFLLLATYIVTSLVREKRAPKLIAVTNDLESMTR